MRFFKLYLFSFIYYRKLIHPIYKVKYDININISVYIYIYITLLFLSVTIMNTILWHTFSIFVDYYISRRYVVSFATTYIDALDNSLNVDTCTIKRGKLIEISFVEDFN